MSFRWSRDVLSQELLEVKVFLRQTLNLAAVFIQLVPGISFRISVKS